MFFLTFLSEKSRKDGKASILAGDFFVDEFAKGGEHIVEATQVSTCAASFDSIGPASKERGANTSFMHISFVTTEASGGVPEFGIMPAFSVSSIVTREHDDGIVVDIEFFKKGEN